jgi:FkbM family methyltransferase
MPASMSSQEPAVSPGLVAGALRIARWANVTVPLPRGRDRIALALAATARERAPVAWVRTIDGRRLLVDARWGFDRFYGRGEYEPVVAAAIRPLLGPGVIYVDAGAAFGWYTTMFAVAAGRHGAVHAFEPLSAMRGCLERTCAPHPTVTVHSVALGAADGRARLSSALAGELGHTSLFDAGGGAEEVTIRPLDDVLVDRAAPIGFVKLDIEGGEMDALRGAVATIQRDRPALLVEVARRELAPAGHTVHDVTGLLAELGYRLYAIDERREHLVEFEHFAPDDYGANVIGLPRERTAPALGLRVVTGQQHLDAIHDDYARSVNASA